MYMLAIQQYPGPGHIRPMCSIAPLTLNRLYAPMMLYTFPTCVGRVVPIDKPLRTHISSGSMLTTQATPLRPWLPVSGTRQEVGMHLFYRVWTRSRVPGARVIAREREERGGFCQPSWHS